MTIKQEISLSQRESKLLQEFERESGLGKIRYEIAERSSGRVIQINLSNPNERFFSAINLAEKNVPVDDLFPSRLTIKKKAPSSYLDCSETSFLLKEISENLSVNRQTRGEDFFARYIPSVGGFEEKVAAKSNVFVLGRRGSGKSSLLMQCFQKRRLDRNASVWIDFQLFAHRSDSKLFYDVLAEILRQVSEASEAFPINDLLSAIERIESISEHSEDGIRALIPDLQRPFSKHIKFLGGLFIFFDDFHVLPQNVQPKLLAVVYSLIRSSQAYLKASGIEQFTRTYDPVSRIGLEIPHDAQFIRLDFNLTMIEKATSHIISILNRFAEFSGLPSISVLFNRSDALKRLVWVAAGVPRDALNIFSLAYTKSVLAKHRLVSISSINFSSSELLFDKMRSIDSETNKDEVNEIRKLLERIKEFCIKTKKSNAFLIKIDDSKMVLEIKKLIDLRLLHIIHEGITVDKAGERHFGLVLDYGFYMGMRATRSLELFNEEGKSPKYEDLRRLPVFRTEG